MEIENWKLKIGKVIKYSTLSVLLVSLGFFSMKFLSWRSSMNETKETVAVISNETTGGKVLGEEGNQVPTKMFASQNFKTPQITFGGDAIAMPAGQQSVVPEIQDMRSELLMAKTDQQVKFLLTWKTNKLCRSSIEYMKEGQAEGKTVSDEGYGFIHSAEVAPLNYSTSYSYIVTVRDKWGNEMRSDKLAFYTGAQNVSIFDLIAAAFKDMFGWMRKK
ncbi:MAG: hypothetical protein WC726_00775 [Parcubacteria group bacterium]|jgi:hypothetical protein